MYNLLRSTLVVMIILAGYSPSFAANLASSSSGVYQERVQSVNQNDSTIFTHNEKLVRLVNDTTRRAEFRNSQGKVTAIELSQLPRGQWFAVKSNRQYYDTTKHMYVIDAQVIYLIPNKLSDEELNKLVQ